MKKKIMILIAFFLAVAMSGLVLGDEEYCFLTLHKGQSTSDKVYTCDHTLCWPCVVSSTRAYASWTRCDSYCDASETDNNDPLTLNVNWPFSNGAYYTRQSFFLDITTNNIASISMIDNIAGTQKSLCPNCNTYNKYTYFKQGFNDITIMAVKGLEVQQERITFYVDNKKPVISRTLPLSNKYFASTFFITYSENNLQEIKLNYGNNLTGMKQATLAGCESGLKKNCSIDIPLNEYDGQEISYWFVIQDLAGNNATSRTVKVKVDETLPEITFFSHELVKNYLNFNMTINEKNFYKVEYRDNNDLRPVWKTICSSLRLGNCFKKIYFRTGEHDLDIRVSDKAGNYAFEKAIFTI